MNSLLRKYTGEPKNPFDQFVKLNFATAELPEIVEKNADQYTQILSDLLSDEFVPAANFFAYYRVLTALKRSGDDRWAGLLRHSMNNLRKNGFWVERSCNPSAKIGEVENTVFAPQPVQFLDLRFAERLIQIANNRGLEQAEGALNRIFQMLEKEIDPHRSLYRRLTYDLDRTPFEALTEIHFEAANNASLHALGGPANPNSAAAQEGFLGDIQYLQLTSISSTASQNRNSQSWPEEFFQYHDSYRSIHPTKDVRFLSVSYVDNGPGILPHIGAFGNTEAKKAKTIKEVIDENVSTRQDSRAGEGFENVRDAVADANGCLLIYSAKDGYYFNGVNGEEGHPRGISERGTILNIIFPI